MSEHPVSENLICDYLDNQLSSAARAKFESRLASDPKLRELVGALRRQSTECAALPKFKLDDRFAERLLEREEPRATMREYADDMSPFTPGPAGIRTAHLHFRSAVAAIASLAALVLITLFLQMSGAEKNVSVANKATDRAAKESATGSDKPNSKKTASHPSLNDTLESMALKDAESDIAIDRPDHAAKKGSVPMNMQLGTEPDVDSKMDRQTVNSIDRRAANARDGMNPQSLESDSIVQSQIAGVPSPPSDAGQSVVTREADMDQADPVESTVELNDVIEINYAGGPEKLAVFHSALLKNEIAIDAAPRGNPRQNVLAKETRSAELAESGKSLGAEVDGRDHDENNDLAANKNELDFSPGIENQYRFDTDQAESNSQAFLITATPEQMAGLITDLQDQADVAAFRLSVPPPGPGPVDEWQYQLESESAAGADAGLGGRGRPREAESQTPLADSARSAFDQQAPRQSAVEQRKSEEQYRRSQSMRSGLATQLEPQIEWRNQRPPNNNQAVQGDPQPTLKNPGDNENLQLQLDKRSSGKLDLLNSYFGSINKDMPAQKYLLMVRLNDSAALRESEQAPPAAVDPGDGDR